MVTAILYLDNKRAHGEEHDPGQVCDDDHDTVFKQLQGVDSEKNPSISRNFILQHSSDSAAKDQADEERQRKEVEKNQIIEKAALDRQMEKERERVEEEQRQRKKARQQEEEKRKESEKERERLENLERIKASALIDEERKREEVTRMKKQQAEEAANLRRKEIEKEIEEGEQRKVALKREEEKKALEIRFFQQKEQKLMEFCEIVKRKIFTTMKRSALRLWIHKTTQRIAENEKKVIINLRTFFTFYLSPRHHISYEDIRCDLV